MPDWSSWIPEEMPMPDLLFSGIPTFRHLQMIFQYHIARITPSADVYGRAGCVPVHCQQYGRAGWVPFYRQQYGGTGIRVASPVPDCSMPMPSYEKNTVCRGIDDTIFVFSKLPCFYTSFFFFFYLTTCHRTWPVVKSSKNIFWVFYTIHKKYTISTTNKIGKTDSEKSWIAAAHPLIYTLLTSLNIILNCTKMYIHPLGEDPRWICKRKYLTFTWSICEVWAIHHSVSYTKIRNKTRELT
jgi:hypothetical protein